MLAAAGCNACVVDVNKETAEETAALVRDAGVKCLAVAADVRDFPALEAAAQKTRAEFGRLDFCVANAGLGRVGQVHTMNEADFDTVMDVNVKGVWFTVKACSREMIRANNGGRVVVVASANSGVCCMHASVATCHPGHSHQTYRCCVGGVQ